MIYRHLPLIVLLLCTACAEEPEPAPPTAVAVVVASPPPPPAPPAVTSLVLADLVQPGDTLEAVRTRLGLSNAVAGKVPGAEGEELDGWILYPDDPARRVSVYLDEAGLPTMLKVEDEASGWQRADGVTIGMDSNALETRNGRAFEFSGFDWDYGGYINDWRGGAFAPQAQPIGSVRLCPPEFAEGVYPEGYPSGDAAFASDDPIVKAHPPKVCVFDLNLASATAP